MAIKTNVDIEVRTNNGENKIKDIDNNSKSAAKSIGALKAAVAVVFASTVVRSIIDTNVQFEKLNASLKTVTGSYENAEIAFGNLERFTTSTPYQLDEVVSAFIKLKSLGLDPSNEALRSYGNTASSMGKSLDQMIEAVADAATGEFERLKEFGIRSRKQGDEVTLTFQGVRTTIKNSSSEITRYLRDIGENQFATGMEDQMNTLGGVFSNFEDATARLSRALMQETGLAGALKTVTRTLTSSINIWAELLEGKSPIQKMEDQLEDLIKQRDNLEKFSDVGPLQKWISSLSDADPVAERVKDKVYNLDMQIWGLQETIREYWDTLYSKEGKDDLSKVLVGSEEDLMTNIDHLNRMNVALKKLYEQAEEPVKAEIFDEWDRALELIDQQFADLDEAAARSIAGFDNFGDRASENFEIVRDAAGSMTSALEDELVNAALKGEFSVKKMADAIIADLVRIGVRAAITAPIMSAFGITPSANGNVFSGGEIIPFAKGGVVSKPTIFPMANGAGLMGEDGAEAIMPLQRGADGKLGVKASVQSSPSIIVNNYSSSSVSTSESTSVDGKRVIELLVEDKIGGMVQSGKMDKLLRPYGINRRGSR